VKVSVLIAAYNVAGCIPRALASVQAQTCSNWEAIVVDDVSSDETAVVVTRLARHEPRIRLIRRDHNGGPSAARNTALDAARGEWVAVLDADDAWRPERLERMLAAAARIGAEFVADNQIFFDDILQQEVGVPMGLGADVNPLTVELLFANDREDSPMRLGLMKPLILRKAILERNIRYDETLRYAEDLHFYARLMITGVRAVLLAEAYYLYTSPVGFLSKQRSRSSRTVSNVEARLRISDELIARYGDRLTARARSEISAFRKRAERRIKFERITALRLSRQYGRLSFVVLRYPLDAWKYLMSSRTLRRLTSPWMKPGDAPRPTGSKLQMRRDPDSISSP
jgi:succinoglycan biosynthesis protein ExoO